MGKDKSDELERFKRIVFAEEKLQIVDNN